MADPRSDETTAPDRGRTIQYCARCDGQNLLFDAHAAWNVDTATWEVANVYDEATCLDCGRAGVGVVTRRGGGVHEDAWTEGGATDAPSDSVETVEDVAAKEMADAAHEQRIRDQAFFAEGV